MKRLTLTISLMALLAGPAAAQSIPGASALGKAMGAAKDAGAAAKDAADKAAADAKAAAEKAAADAKAAADKAAADAKMAAEKAAMDAKAAGAAGAAKAKEVIDALKGKAGGAADAAAKAAADAKAAGEKAAAAGDVRQTQAIFELYEASFPDDVRAPTALWEIAKAMESHGDTDEAIRYYQKVFDRHHDAPIAPQAVMRIAEIYVIKGDCGRAKSILKFAGDEFKSGPEGAAAKKRLKELGKDCK